MGIEPTSEAWEASILPLYDARSTFFRLYPRIDRGKSGFTTAADGGAGSQRRRNPLNLHTFHRHLDRYHPNS
jgi:hypothetical protein